MSTLTDRDAPLLVRLLLKHGDVRMADLERLQVPLAALPANPEGLLLANNVSDERTMAMRIAQYVGCSWLELDAEQPGHVLEGFPPDQMRKKGALDAMLQTCRDAVSRVPESVFRNRRVMPTFIAGGTLHVVAADPLDHSAVEELQMILGMRISVHAGTVGMYRMLMQVVFGDRDKVNEVLVQHVEKGEEESAHGVDLDLNQSIGGKDSGVLKLVNSIVLQAIEEGASDIHCEPYESFVRVRYRVDGSLREVAAPPPKMFQQAISRMKILAKMDIAEKRVPQDGAITVREGDKRVDLRVSTVPTVYGEKMVMRLLEKTQLPKNLTALGFTEQQAKDFAEAVESPHGLVFVTGPTGSGKSTTLYTALGMINDAERNIVTVEDPVEYKLHGLNQVQVHGQAGLTFAAALRSFLRQDPDVIMVGEVRDAETAQICMRAALTGHLVLSTLHTNSGLQVIYRLIDMGVEPFLLGPALRILQAQRLVRRLCPACRRKQELPAETALRHGLEPGVQVWLRGKDANCATCRGRGSRGRLGIYEVLRITEDVQDRISARVSLEDMRSYLGGQGVKFLADDARAKVLAGHTSFEEVADYIRVA